MRFESHDEYFASVAGEVVPLLRQIQAQVEEVVPDAQRCIGYNMPAYRQSKIFFYFAAFKKHIGIYPPVAADNELIDKLQPYRGEKGNLSFPLDAPLPIELIGQAALALSRQCRVK